MLCILRMLSFVVSQGREGMHALAQKCMQLKHMSGTPGLLNLILGILSENTEVRRSLLTCSFWKLEMFSIINSDRALLMSGGNMVFFNYTSGCLSRMFKNIWTMVSILWISSLKLQYTTLMPFLEKRQISMHFSLDNIGLSSSLW